MASSVVPALPWMVRVLSPEIAAASNSLSQLLAVPGSPISIRPRLVASATTQRSSIARRPTNFGAMPAFSSPRMNFSTLCGVIRQPGGLGFDASAAVNRASSPACSTSEAGRCSSRRAADGLVSGIVASEFLLSDVLLSDGLDLGGMSMSLRLGHNGVGEAQHLAEYDRIHVLDPEALLFLPP